MYIRMHMWHTTHNLVDVRFRYENPVIALNCGMMLRECIKHEALAKMILQTEDFFRFFEYVEVSTFDVASDTFTVFKELLTKHKILCAEFLEQNYDRVFGLYDRLLHSENYVTRRQSLKVGFCSRVKELEGHHWCFPYSALLSVCLSLFVFCAVCLSVCQYIYFLYKTLS